nr:hypothetical protein BaRGS_023362 [Batillaria attramentaria]
MTREERAELIQRLQDDLEDFVAEQSKKAREKKLDEEPDDRTIDEIAEELKNHPAFMTDVDWSKPLSPEMEGLMALKYESENPVARANSYREEGNELFKKKDYRVAIDNYTEGIKSKSPDREQNAVLYTNRAAAQYHLGALCCDKMNKHADAIRWCEAGLMDKDGCLHWPVLFLYPEYGQTDFIQDFHENSTFLDHIQHMFGPGAEPAAWDEAHKYTPDSIQIYFEDQDTETLHAVSKYNTLLEALRHKKKL